ncbi:MAG: hypothetical protein SF182_03610 [Deltaproteobacteria bacterium]|nr:hypothetical protein [Deltaproteobacteria bacterium]
MRRDHKGRYSRRGLSRRQFIAGTTAAGLTIGLPPWLTGCGDDGSSKPGATPTPTATPVPTPTVGPRPVEDCSLNFDLSAMPFEDLEIRVYGSEDDGVRLQPHTAESRAHFRDENPALAEVDDQFLTHYVEDVTLPSDALQLYWVTGCLRSGEDALAGINIHVPQEALLTFAETAAARGRAGVRTAKMQHYGIGAQQQDVTDLFPGVGSFVNVFDAATTLLFLQPDLMNLNVAQGMSILHLLQTLPCTGVETCEDAYINTLAFRIASAWPATESGVVTVGGREVTAWAKLTPVLDVDGNQLLDSQGDPAVNFDISDEIAATVASVARDLRKFILNSSEFEGFNWHPTRGMTTDEQAGGDTNRRSRVFMSGTQAVDQAVAVVGEHAAGTTAHGVQFSRIAVVDQAKRTVEVDVRNHFIRFVSAYVRFADESGELPFTPDTGDTPRSKFLRLLNSNFTVMGIPLLGDDVPKETFRFDIPANATKARLYFGSLGVGGEAFSPEAVTASVATLGFNIGLPTLLLATGTAATAGLQGTIKGFLQTDVGRRALGLIVIRAIALAGPQVANGIFGTKNSGNAKPVLISLANAVISTLLSSGEAASLYIAIGLVFISNKLGDLTGPIGMAFKAAALAADVATLGQTVAEVLSSPAVFTNTLSLRMTTTVTVLKDPDNSTFPARARFYEVTLTYDEASKVAHKLRNPIPPNSAEPLVASFTAVPSGGNVSVEVLLLDSDDTIVGGSVGADDELGPVGPLPNNPANAGEIEITIRERVIPLTAQTRYVHQRKLAYQQGARVWLDGASAPTATRDVLCQGQDDRLCNLTGITISQRTGNLGYAYQAGGPGVAYCGEVAGGVMHLVQNISLISGRDRALKQISCGFREPAGILYDRLGPADGRGRNFYVRPAAGGYFLQSIVLDDTTPIDLATPLSWGRFSQPMDALALHPMGYVVGVNRSNHKMEILQLPARAVNGDQAPDAIPFAVQKAGEGDRAGLLSVPVALTVFEGAILVLESGNARVQAFDVSGNPVNLFANKTSPTFALADRSATHLDISVDGVGYVYVLSYANSGTSPADYRLDIYTPEGVFLTRTENVTAARLTVDTFRSMYALNYETLAGAPRVEPSISHWVPNTPA